MLFFKALGRRAIKPLFFGDDHLDDLAAPGDEISQELGFGIGERPDDGRPCGFREACDHGGVERIGFRSLAERLGEGPDLRRIDDCDRKPGRGQGRRRNGFELTRWASKAMVTGFRAPSLAQRLFRPFALRSTANPSPEGQSATSSLFFETSIPTNTGCVFVSTPAPPCLNGLGLRPWRLFGDEVEQFQWRGPHGELVEPWADIVFERPANPSESQSRDF